MTVDDQCDTRPLHCDDFPPFRYVLWAMEKFRQGWKPEDFRIKPKKRKVVRG